jgi:hypothetical protein
VLAAIRPDSINIALLLHVGGAMLLVGALLTTGLALVAAWRRTDDSAVALTRFGLRSLLFAVLPAYVLMRVGAQWTESREHYPDGYDPSWLGIGYITADAGAFFILVSLVGSYFGLRQLRNRSGGSPIVARVIGVIALALVATYLVAVWAMSTKPS